MADFGRQSQRKDAGSQNENFVAPPDLYTPIESIESEKYMFVDVDHPG